MTRKEQIIEVLQKHIFADGDIWVIYDLKKMYDDLLPILALPLDVPSDDEMMETIWEETDVSLSLKDKEENTAAYARWAIWMRDEIIKRNTKK